MRTDRILYKVIAGLLLCCLAVGCSDEEWERPMPGEGVDMGKLVNVKVPFCLSPRLKVNITTRAGVTDQQGIDSQLSGIMVYVFENKGEADGATEKRVAYKLFGAPGQQVEGANESFVTDPNDPTRGYFNLHAPVGDVYIYLVGNAKSSFINDVFEEIKQSGKQLDTRQEFLELVLPKWTGNMNLVAGYLPMAGKVNNSTGACTIAFADPNNPNSNDGIIQYYKDGDTTTPITLGESGQNYSEDHSFVLSRLMSKVSMKFVNGKTSVKFTPLTYKFYHCSTEIPPVAEYRNSPLYSDAVQDTETVPFDVQTPDRFTVYLPENVRTYQPGPGGKQQLTFADRDKVKKNADGSNQTETGHKDHYEFEYAPANSTYVEITGHLENTDKDRSANVRYLIHLGDFSVKDATNPAPDRFNDFSLLRDHHYDYTVTVNGVDDIVVEVKNNNDADPQNNSDERNPAVEGVVFEGGARVRLDAHYEQVEMHLQATHFTNGVFIYADTPFGIVHGKYIPSQVAGTPGVLDTDYPNSHTKDEMVKLLDWVEFKKQTAAHTLASYADAGNGMEQRKNVFEVLDYIYQNPSNEGYYTCFVNEYYYEHHPLEGTLTLEDFVNAPDRTFSLGSNIQYSADGKSAVSTAVYMLQQSSIACFYDLANTDIAKYGVELVDEIGELPYGTPAAEASDNKKGRINTLAELGSIVNTPVVDWEKNGFVLDANGKYTKPGKNRLLSGHQEAYLACLTRNRDVDGDGCISGNELRWYTPARDQVLGLWIGEPAMPAEAALYPYPTSQLPANTAGSQYPVYSSSSGQGRVIYGDESGCFGDISSANGSGFVRIVRNLGRGNFAQEKDTYLTSADAYYLYNSAERTIELYLTSNALRAYTSRELVPHHERDLVNRPHRKFQVAEKPYVLPGTSKDHCDGHPEWWEGNVPPGDSDSYQKLYTTSAATAKKSTTTEAYKYAGNEATVSTASWRLPNQRELLLMIVAMGTEFDYNMDHADYHHMNYVCNEAFLGNHRWEMKNNYILHCRTSFSNSSFSEFGYMYNTQTVRNDGRKMQMMWRGDTKFGMGDNGTAGFICVRDVK